MATVTVSEDLASSLQERVRGAVIPQGIPTTRARGRSTTQ